MSDELIGRLVGYRCDQNLHAFPVNEKRTEWARLIHKIEDLPNGDSAFMCRKINDDWWDEIDGVIYVMPKVTVCFASEIHTIMSGSY